MREKLSGEIPQIERVVERNGKTYIMNTANIGQSLELRPQGQQYIPMTLEETQELEPQPEPIYQSPAPVYIPPTSEQLDTRVQSLERWQQDNIALGLDRWGEPLPMTPVNQIDEQEEDTTTSLKSSTLLALQSSESNEWYTPAQYVEAARMLMGGIDSKFITE